MLVNLGANSEATAFIAAIVRLARALGHSVVAEGVETDVQRGRLEAIGCKLMQGYLFGRPVDRDATDEVLRGTGRLLGTG